MEAQNANLELPAESVVFLSWIEKFSASVGSGTGFRHLGYYASERDAWRVAEEAFKRQQK